MPTMGNLEELIHLATSSTGMEIDERQLKGIKAIVRASDDCVPAAVALLMDRLAKNHAQVRYLALLIIDELFTRSKLFRGLVLACLESFLVLSIGYKAKHPLPPPTDRAAILKSKALEVLEKWNDMFGPHYKQLRLGYDYLKKTLRLNFPGIREAATRAQEERTARERRTQELLKCRLSQLTENFGELKKDIQSTIDQMEECFALLKQEKNEAAATFDEDEQEEYGIRSLRLARQVEEVALYESQDNSAIFNMARDLFKLLTTRHIPAAQEWLSLLMRVDPDDRQSRDAVLRKVIDLRNVMSALKSRCEAELGIEVVAREKDKTEHQDNEDDDDIEWEDEQPPLAADATTSATAPATSTHLQEEAAINSIADEARQKILKEAPVLPWGSFLDSWGSQAGVPANARGVALDNHWGRVDPDVVIPFERLAKLQVRASYYQPEKKDIRPCSAPLKKGGLCPRRDLHRCPLHGTIIPRDVCGNPLQQQQSEEPPRKTVAPSIPSAEAPSPASVAAQAVRNVRDRDRAKKTQAKADREHNEAVLRTAALSGRRQGLEELVPEEATTSSRKRKGGGLAAMLHKKPTAKDRIAKRLLTGRARDASVAQSAQEEDIRYREAFPNQW